MLLREAVAAGPGIGDTRQEAESRRALADVLRDDPAFAEEVRTLEATATELESGRAR
jgi:hypothetical protein